MRWSEDFTCTVIVSWGAADHAQIATFEVTIPPNSLALPLAEWPMELEDDATGLER